MANLSPEQVERLLRRYQAGETLSDQESDQLGDWIHNVDTDAFAQATEALQATEAITAQAERTLEAKLDLIGVERHEVPVHRIHRVHFLRKSWLRYAAALILIFGAAGSLLILKPWKKQTTEVAVTKPLFDIQPGSKKAFVTLGNGQQVPLDQVGAGEKIGNAVKTADGKLVYLAPAQAEAVVLNTVTVPRGGVPQFVELPDRTLVWVNTNSSITYPTSFTGSTREVSMTGQVYYEVAKEASGRKLYAQTRTDRIEVRGTHFDICAYDDEPFVRTTLFEGSVKIGNSLLVPGDQYENGGIKKLSPVELDRVIAWKNGMFSFGDVDVRTLMRELSRSYDVEVIFEGEPTRRRFKGDIGRGLTITELLDGLKFTKLNYRLEKTEKGNRIVMLP